MTRPDMDADRGEPSGSAVTVTSPPRPGRAMASRQEIDFVIEGNRHQTSNLYSSRQVRYYRLYPCIKTVRDPVVESLTTVLL